MGLIKYALLLSTIFSLTSCNGCSDNSVLKIHARFEDGDYDREIDYITVSSRIGCDISHIEVPNKEIYDSHPGIIKGIFIDKNEQIKIKASQLKQYDGSFKDIYVLYDYIDYDGKEEYCINEKTFFDGLYVNCCNETLTMNMGEIYATYSDYSITTCIERNHTLGYCINGANIVNNEFSYSLSDFEHIDNSINFSLQNFSFDDYGKLTFVNDLTKCAFMFNAFYDVVCNIKQESLDIKNFVYLKNNTSSINYDI